MDDRIQLMFGGLLVVALASPACVLVGIEPDEIDVAHESGESGEPADTDNATDSGIDESDDEGTGNEGQTGDGDGDPTGDGDGDDTSDPSTTGGDGDGDGDGDSTGDGDGDESGCTGFRPSDLVVGENQVAIADAASALSSTCGGAGAESVYRFVAPSEGTWSFEVTQAEFVEVLTLVGACDPLQELTCSGAPASAQLFMTQGQVVYVVVDSESGTGPGLLVVSPS